LIWHVLEPGAFPHTTDHALDGRLPRAAIDARRARRRETHVATRAELHARLEVIAPEHAARRVQDKQRGRSRAVEVHGLERLEGLRQAPARQDRAVGAARAGGTEEAGAPRARARPPLPPRSGARA